MLQFIEFVGNHPFLFLALGVVSGLLAWNLLGANLYGISNLAPAQAIQLINHEDALLLDVREDGEYQGGHILNSMHIPLSALPERIKRLEKYRAQPIIVGCRSGHRSMQAGLTLKKQGFERIYNLQGGILAWQNANLPLTTVKQ